MLHIVDGESTRGTLSQTGLPGEKFACRETLLDGPVIGNLQSEEWRRIRAKHISESYGLDLLECEKSLSLQEDTLQTFHQHDEVVLWFEHDLFCQTNLLYLLNWFSEKDLGGTRLTLISIDRFAGIEDFRGFGQLNAEQLSSLFPTRREIKEVDLELARVAWQAYSSSDPASLESLTREDLPAFPFLRHALRLHLERFPSVRNGLGRIEQRGLELIDSGLHRFTDLFAAFGTREPVYGLGDFQFWLALKRLTDVREPLLRLSGPSEVLGPLTPQRVRESAFELTEAGRDVVGNRADFVELNGIDLWFGGVHLLGNQDIWRWDGEGQRLVMA